MLSCSVVTNRFTGSDSGDGEWEEVTASEPFIKPEPAIPLSKTAKENTASGKSQTGNNTGKLIINF